MSNDTFSERLAYPKGLKGIIANESALSDVRGEEGRLLYLGYDIDDLVEMCCFEEVVYLLLNKRLPNREELEGIKKRLRSDRDLPQPILDFFKTATKSARPMSALRTAVSMLGMYDDRTKDARAVEGNRPQPHCQGSRDGGVLLPFVPGSGASPRSGGSERGGTFPVVAEG